MSGTGILRRRERIAMPEPDARNRQEFYEQLHASGWTDELAFLGPTMLIRKHAILRELARIPDLGEKRILDVGCGNLALLKAVGKARGARMLFGADITDASFHGAAHGIETRVFDITTSVWEGGMFDVILCADMLEHVDDAAAIANMRCMLSPGGIFVFHVPFSMKNWSAHDESVGHLRRYSGSDLAEKLQSAGFESINMKTYGFPFLSMYFRLLLKHVPPHITQRKKSLPEKLVSIALYSLFRCDMLFADSTCRRGFAIIGTAR